MATPIIENAIDPNDVYQQIINTVDSGKGVLERLYNIDKAAFDINIINKIILFCHKKEYGLPDLLELQDIVKLTIFRQYGQEKNVDQLNILEKCLDAYLLAICKYKNQNFYLIRNKLLPLLRVRTKPPFGEPDLIAKGKVSIKHPEGAVDRKMNNNVDVAQMIRTQQMHIRNSPCEQLSFNDRSNHFGAKKIILTGQIYPSIASALLSLQSVMLKSDSEMGIDVKPFLEVSTFKWEV